MENYSNVPVCQEPGTVVRTEKRRPECGDGCRVTLMEEVTVEEVARVLSMNSSYCMSYYCDDGSNEWKLGMELCECAGAEVEEMFETVKREAENTSLPYCCGENSVFNFELEKCESGGKELHTFTSCNYKNKTKARFKKHAEAEHEDLYQCIGAVQGSVVGGIVCEPVCNGSVSCVR